MKKITLFLFMVVCCYVANSQCSNIYGITWGSFGSGYAWSLTAVDRYTGTLTIRDTIFSMRSLVGEACTIETDSNRYITLGYDTASHSVQRIYIINFNTGQVLYQPVCDSNVYDLHYDVKRKKIFALMEETTIYSTYQWWLVTINPYTGSLNFLDSITGMRTLIGETDCIGIDSGRYYVMGLDGSGLQWLYALDEATGNIKYKQPGPNIYECQYDTISKNIYGVYDTGSGPYVWFFSSFYPSTGVVNTAHRIPGMKFLSAFTSAFAQDSLQYFTVGDTTSSGTVEAFYTISATSGNVLSSPILGSGSPLYEGSEYDPCNASYCTNNYNEPICMATVDTTTNKAEIIWGRTNSPPATGSYNVYKDSDFSYTLIHNQSLNALSEYLDTTSYPSLGPESYEISTLDSCGESALSPPHTTMYLTTTAGVNVYILNWTAYVGFTPTLYRIFRGPTMSSLVQVDSVPNTVLTFHDTLPPLGSYYAIEAVNPSGICVPTSHRPIRPSATLSGSFSNGFNTGLIVTGNKAISTPINLNIYPNPGDGLFMLNYSAPEISTIQISVIDELGQVVYAENKNTHIGSNTEQLNLENLAAGIYMLRIQTNNSITVKKLVIMGK